MAISLKPATSNTNPRYTVVCELERLSNHFGISPRLHWSHGRRKGIYLPKDDTISMGPKAWDLKAVLVHSFSHAVTHKDCLLSSHFDVSFLNILWKVVLFVYSDPNKFPWYGEPNVVFEFGKNRCRAWSAFTNE